jgi:hypothetical protein
VSDKIFADLLKTECINNLLCLPLPASPCNDRSWYKPDEAAWGAGNWGRHLDLWSAKNHAPGVFRGALWNVSFSDSA